MFWLQKPYRNATPSLGRLSVGGIVERPNFGFTFDDLARVDAKHQVSDVGAYATPARVEGRPLQGVRIAAIAELVAPDPDVLYMLARTHGKFSVSVWRREVERLAIIAYARAGKPLPAEIGGPFRLLLPGFNDESRDLWDVAVIEFSNQGGRDSRNERARVPEHSHHPGEIQGGLSRWVVDPSEARTIVSPPPS